MEIIFTSDTHGHVFPMDYPTGKKENSGLLHMARRVEKKANMLILDGGDTLQGTPLSQYYIAHSADYAVHPMAEAFNALGCDYFTLGNHDFNFGYDTLKQYLDAMHGVCVCANVEDFRGELGIKKHVIRVMENGLRVGITGIVTDYVMIWEQPQNLTELRVTDAFAAAGEECRQLRGACDFCICIYHGGFEEDLETGKRLTDSTENVACRIARELEFDLLLTGHQHMAVEGKWLYGTYVVQPPANGTHYVRIQAEDGKITSSLEPAGEQEEEETYARLLPVEQDTQRWLDVPVGRLAERIAPERKIDAALYGSRLAELFNRVQLAETGADFSCTSLGNSPVGLEREVTMRNICGAYLFANTLVVLEVDEAVLKAALERCAAYFTLRDGQPEIAEEFLKPKIEHYNYDFYSGLHYVFDLTRPVGERVTELTKADGTPLGKEKYRLVTSNYRATGTGGYEALGKCPVLWRGAKEMPELIAGYIAKHSPVFIEKYAGPVVKLE